MDLLCIYKYGQITYVGQVSIISKILTTKLTDEARAQGEGFDKLDLSAEDAPVHLLLAVFTARDMLTKPRFFNYCYFLSSHFPKKKS